MHGEGRGGPGAGLDARRRVSRCAADLAEMGERWSACAYLLEGVVVLLVVGHDGRAVGGLGRVWKESRAEEDEEEV